MKGVPQEEWIAHGHRACAGCGCMLALRYVMKALGKNTVVVSATGCMEVVTTPYPHTAWKVPWIHVAFENAASVASGVARALKVRGRDDVKVVAIAGDGGTADIGLQALSGALERNENILYVCYDNEAYENTGIQRSGSTPLYAWTTTTPVGKRWRGEDQPKKNLPEIVAAHGIPYVATASIAYPLDLIKKVQKAASIKGPTYLHVHATCVPGWRVPENRSVEVARMAVLTGAWILYEVEGGQTRVTFKPTPRKPVAEYLKLQGRFRHLTDKEIAEVQRLVDEQCKKFGI